MSFNGNQYASAGASVVMTTKGDIVRYDSARERLGIGSANQVLQVSGGLPTWQTLSTADSVLTTRGDILYEDASGLQRLAAGTSGDFLKTQGSGADPVWATVAADADVNADILVMANSTTIGDYTQPSASTCSSSESTSPATQAITGTFGYNHDIYNGGETAKGIRFNSGAAMIGETISGMSMYMKKTGSPTGTLYFRLYDSSDVLQATFGTLDVSTLTGSYVEKSSGTVTDTATVVAGDRLVVEYSGGDASNKVGVEVAASCLYDCSYTEATTLLSSGSWSQNATNDYHMSWTYYSVPNPCSNAIDDNTSTSWKSSSEANPNIYVDMGSSTTTSNLALYPNAGTTETEIKIQSSPNASAWTDQRTITWSNLTEGAWNYIRFNVVSARYWRIYGNSGSSVVMQIDEIKVLDGVSDADVRNLHGHISISASDTSLNNAGV